MPSNFYVIPKISYRNLNRFHFDYSYRIFNQSFISSFFSHHFTDSSHIFGVSNFSITDTTILKTTSTTTSFYYSTNEPRLLQSVLVVLNKTSLDLFTPPSNSLENIILIKNLLSWLSYYAANSLYSFIYTSLYFFGKRVSVLKNHQIIIFELTFLCLIT